MVRFFAGWDFTDEDVASRTPAFQGYRKGVPMGGDLKPRTGNPRLGEPEMGVSHCVTCGRSDY